MIWEYILDSEWNQRADIEAQKAEIKELKRHLRHHLTSDPAEADLRKQNGKLKLYIAVLFRLMISKGLASRDEIWALIEQIDAEDGQADDSFSGKVIP